MNCGIPYCHTGCPVNNQIPDWNDLVYHRIGRRRARNLHSTNNFPEFTGRICPAPCEAACTLNLSEVRSPSRPSNAPIVDRAGDGWIKPEPPNARPASASPSWVPARPASPARSSSPAPAMKCMSSRRTPKPGGLLRYGIPDFKMEKHLIDRRVDQMVAEGVSFMAASMSASISIPISLLANTMLSCSPAAPKSRAICRSRAAISPVSISPWSFCRSRTGGSAASRS